MKINLITAWYCALPVIQATVVLDTKLNDDWEEFKTTYNKHYISQQEEYRRRVKWENNWHYIQQHNEETEKGLHTFILGVNEYADMDNEEFTKTMNGMNPSLGLTSCGHYLDPHDVMVSELPAEVDWRKNGYVTEVKNQGQCGSCWAFSATGSLEGQHFNKTKQLVSLSEKNLMDCSKLEGNKGCEGGLMDKAFEYVIRNHGIDTEESYPYKAKDGKCEFNKDTIGATASGCKEVWKGSEVVLQKAVATVGPIAVGIDASLSSFQLYKSGVYSDILCSPRRIDHGVLAVGYGTDDVDYWLVKNSWGTTWGMEGYIKMGRNNHNQCGIASQASFPVS